MVRPSHQRPHSKHHQQRIETVVPVATPTEHRTDLANHYVSRNVKRELAKTPRSIIVPFCSLCELGPAFLVQLYYFLAILLSLSFGSLPESEQPFAQAVTLSGSILALWWVLCLLASQIVASSIAKGEISTDTGYRLFDRQIECFRWLSLALIVLCLGGFGLGRNLDHLPILEHSVLLQSLVLLAPAALIMLGLWVAEYRFARKFDWVDPGFFQAVRSISSIARSSVGWLLVPILGVMTVIDLASQLPVPEVLPGWTIWCVIIVATLCGIPFLVRRVFPTIPICPETEAWIQSIVTAAGVRRVKVVQWDTNGRTHNAMVAGLLGRFRIVMVSDRLLADLSRQEIAMVMLHELAHVKRFHLPLRILSLIPAWGLGAVVQQMANQPHAAMWLQTWSSLLGSAVSLLATVSILRLVSYRSEYDADQFACELAPAVAMTCDDVPKNSIDAAAELANALLRVTPGGDDTRRASWLHPGINDRVERLARFETNPQPELNRSCSLN